MRSVLTWLGLSQEKGGGSIFMNYVEYLGILNSLNFTEWKDGATRLAAMREGRCAGSGSDQGRVKRKNWDMCGFRRFEKWRRRVGNNQEGVRVAMGGERENERKVWGECKEIVKWEKGSGSEGRTGGGIWRVVSGWLLLLLVGLHSLGTPLSSPCGVRPRLWATHGKIKRIPSQSRRIFSVTLHGNHIKTEKYRSELLFYSFSLFFLQAWFSYLH